MVRRRRLTHGQLAQRLSVRIADIVDEGGRFVAERSRTIQHADPIVHALKQFGIWLVRTRRVQHDPFDGLKPLNEAADRRHVRRALTPEEAERLLEAARTRLLSWTFRGKPVGPKSLAERVRLEQLGETRALVYALALGTGLRKGELRNLRWCDVDLDAGRVTVTAASAKSRRAQSVPLSKALAGTLRGARPADASPTDPVIPAGDFPNTTTFHRDLEAAGVAREDAEGRVVDFHALRTRESGRQRFVYIHVLVPDDWTVKHSHDVAERFKADLASVLPGVVTFAHVEPRDDPASYGHAELHPPVPPRHDG